MSKFKLLVTKHKETHQVFILFCGFYSFPFDPIDGAVIQISVHSKTTKFVCIHPEYRGAGVVKF